MAAHHVASALSGLARPQARPRFLPTRVAPASRRATSGRYGYTQAESLYFTRHGEPGDVLGLHTHSIGPQLPDGAALLRTLAAPINPADVNTIQGTYGTKPVFSTLALGTVEPAAIPGSEGCFEVQSVGRGVTALKPGDWCIPATAGLGTFRTHAVVADADKQLHAVDGAGLTTTAAATASVNPCSAYRMLRDYVDLAGSGMYFVQNGANSSVGRAVIQLASRWGFRSINIVRDRSTPRETSALKAALVSLGATHVFSEAEFLDRSFAASVLPAVTNDGAMPVLLGLNCVGGASAEQMTRCLSAGGTMVTYGAMSRRPFAVAAGRLIFQQLNLQGFWLGRWSEHNPVGRRETVDAVLAMMRDGVFKEAPVHEVRWTRDTEAATLRAAVQAALGGFSAGKGMFVFDVT